MYLLNNLAQNCNKRIIYDGTHNPSTKFSKAWLLSVLYTIPSPDLLLYNMLSDIGSKLRAALISWEATTRVAIGGPTEADWGGGGGARAAGHLREATALTLTIRTNYRYSNELLDLKKSKVFKDS